MNNYFLSLSLAFFFLSSPSNAKASPFSVLCSVNWTQYRCHAPLQFVSDLAGQTWSSGAVQGGVTHSHLGLRGLGEEDAQLPPGSYSRGQQSPLKRSLHLKTGWPPWQTGNEAWALQVSFWNLLHLLPRLISSRPYLAGTLAFSPARGPALPSASEGWAGPPRFPGGSPCKMRSPEG